jgi:2-polyprenyl-3-methyl-5-hydroxy-6-metoxy-1,4-benzoquinol methylase
MPLISEQYRRLNAELHERGDYGVSGHKWAMPVNGLALQCEAATVLDYGCGRGTLKQKLDRLVFSGFGGERPCPYRVLEYDPAIPGKDAAPEPADLVVCGDVLEHIEPACLGDVLDHLAALTKKAAFLVIATRPAKKVLSDGRNAHLIVEGPEWWLCKLIDHWRPESFQNRGGEFVFVGGKRD